MAYRFDSHLHPGEVLLWQGKPDEIAYSIPKVFRDLLLAVPIFVLVSWLEFHRTHSIKPGSNTWWGMLAAGLVLTAVFMYKNTRVEAASTDYALTTKRILVRHTITLPTRDTRTKVDTVSLARLRPRLLLAFRGIRTIVFGTPGFEYAIAFRAIRDAEDV